MMGRLRHEEDGYTLISVIGIMTILLMFGAAVLTMVNAQTSQTRVERAGEAAFTVANSALDNHAGQLRALWPGTAAKAYTTCTSTSAPRLNPVPGCAGSSLQSNYGSTTGSDLGTAPTWEVRVLDNTGGSPTYSESLASGPGWDANADGSVWVRASATVGGQQRTMVVMVSAQSRTLTLPQKTVLAGWFRTPNNGRKVIVYTQNPAKPGSVTGPIAVRCTVAAPASGNSCLGYDPVKGQVSPPGSYETGYSGIDASTSALTTAELAAVKAYAQQIGTYYATGCPSSLTSPILADGSRGLIYLENANCTYNGGVHNTAVAPGAVVVGTGTLSFGGNALYYGLLYGTNQQQTSMPSPCNSSTGNSVVSLTGTARVQGAVMVDRCGGVTAGAASANIVFDSPGLSLLRTLDMPTPAKNTFKVLAN